MAITKEVLQELLKDYKGPEDLTGENGLLKQLTKALVESAMGVELTGHLGYEKNETGEKPTENRRNGSSSKTVRSDQGPLELEVPRDRDATFEPRIVEKHQREFAQVQREDSLDVRPRDDQSRDCRAPEGDLRD